MSLESIWNENRGGRAPTLAHVAALELREEILSGKLDPGQPLPLVDTAERLGMSIMPVREAVRRLEFEGLVEQLPQKGARVSPLNIADLEDVYHTRISMESRAVYRAVPKLTQETYRSLSKILDDYREAYLSGDEDAGRTAHEKFHFGLYTLSGSVWMVRMIRLLWDTSERFRRLSIHHRGSIEDRMQEHMEILETCKRQEAERASDLMGEHLHRTMEIVKADMKQRLGSDNTT
ncbi:GntR family transcriptional regulator [Alicyclobacillus sp. SO9]|uniref:GntR family transcriptional regulator n=1 Tax=Alicyclobacillus sp. SO9 TaxID=2665646 RepID=UPI0018E905ED|nr:GntR family transcriptional regulator [Alicyclobacillus sp. SO9]QQE80499.1 GntR family transcriptional regulator [Alicyclobacillus sp. SO9]